MQDPQPHLPFDEQNTLEEIRRLLAVQNELLSNLVERMSESTNHPGWLPDSDLSHSDAFTFMDGEAEDGFLDDDFWDDFEDEEVLPDPPHWFVRHFDV